MNSYTWSYFQKQRISKERKETRMLMLEKLAIIFCYFSLGYFIGRFIEAIVVGHLNFYF